MRPIVSPRTSVPNTDDKIGYNARFKISLSITCLRAKFLRFLSENKINIKIKLIKLFAEVTYLPIDLEMARYQIGRCVL